MATKLLLIEYEPRYIDKVRTNAGEGFEITVARDGDEAIASFEKSRPDIVLLSAVLPKSRANDVIREIRRRGGLKPPPILLMMSGYKGSNPKADAQKIGAFDILEKPFSAETFQSLVNDALDSNDASRTMRIDTRATGSLTSSDIFSDVLDDLHDEPAPPAPAAAPPAPDPRPPAPPPAVPDRRTTKIDSLDAVVAAARPTPVAAPKKTMDNEMHRRLEETLSGVLSERRPTGAATPVVKPAPPAPASPPAPPTPPMPGRPSATVALPLASMTRPAPAAPMVETPRSEPRPSPPLQRPTAPTVLTPPPAAAEGSPKPAARPSTSTEVDQMLHETLSGLGGPAAAPRPKTPVPTPRLDLPEPKRATGPVATTARSVPSDQDRFGQYQLMEKIALGGMAEVYKARMSGVDGFQKIVAIKKILPHMAASEDFITMFADEAKLAAQLNHPNIIHIYDLGKVDNSYYIAMEYVEGRDLRSILKTGAEHGLPLPAELALFIASKLAAALDYAHRRKDYEGRDMSLVHRDVSPQNVLISYEGDIKLCDFGIAKAASKSSQTQIGALKGKLQYMSPEQASGKTVDRRSDIFSLGSVLYEMLTGEKLFAGDSDLTILEQVRTAKVEPPSVKNPDIPKKVDSIVLKALGRDAEDRYQNASDFQRDLESVLYTFSPAPGSADLAIYFHHLQAEEKASSSETERALDSAFAPVPASAPTPAPKSKKAKGTVVQRKTGSVPTVSPAELAALAARVEPAPAAVASVAESQPLIQQTRSGVFGAYSSSRLEDEKKARMPLYVGIGVAAVILVGVAAMLMKKKAAPPAAPPAPAAETRPAPVTPTTAAPSTLTEKSVDEEVKRQLALKKKELEKTQADKKKAPGTAPAASASSTAAPAPAPEKTAEKPKPVPAPAAPAVPAAPAPVPIQVASATPTPFVPKKIEAPAEEAPRPAEAPMGVSRGDLVGPGPGVVEPAIASKLNINYPLAARTARANGTVVVLALVDEEGNVRSASVKAGLASRLGVNEAVLSAVKSAKFRPATKDGVPVKMYKAISVTVSAE
jgi:TonB family protein